ncbi:Mis12 protein-domain-containing protein [Nemania sp. NC0429]|nr:Mis12 protein-domain-containing protein [Nemania sp. NC0429]
MTTSVNAETELLTEHFGYPPVSLIDDIINSINILAERALNSVEQGLLNASPAALGFKAPKPQHSSRSQSRSNQDAAAAAAADSLPPAERAKNEVESGTHQLETLLCASIDRNFDKFEIYVLRNIFTVRPPELCSWIRLSHYDGLDFSSSASASPSVAARDGDNNDNDAPTIESVTALRRRLRESMRLNALLTAERARNEALLEDLRRLVGGPAPAAPQVKAESASPAQQRRSASRDAEAQGGVIDVSKREETKNKSPFAFLHHKGDLASSGGGAAPLATTAAFTLSQMQALRALSTALSNITPDVKASPASAEGVDDDGEGAGSGGSRSWRQERAEYVEAATRRHLETVHGLELGRYGEVRDGEWQGPGRKLARGEVESLERAVTMIGGDIDGDSGIAGASSSAAAAAATQIEDADRMDMDES